MLHYGCIEPLSIYIFNSKVLSKITEYLTMLVQIIPKKEVDNAVLT